MREAELTGLAQLARVLEMGRPAPRPPFRTLCHGAMRGLAPPSLGRCPVEPPGQGTAQPLCGHLSSGGGGVFTVHFTSFLLHPDVALPFTHALLASGFVLLRFASLPDLISIKQQLSSAPAICSTGCVQWVSGIKNTQGGHVPKTALKKINSVNLKKTF